MKTHSELKKVKVGEYTYIYVLYKHKGVLIRINTKNKYVPSCMNKDLTYNSKMLNYVELNQKTLELKRKVDDYLSFKTKHGSIHRISQKECLKYVKEGEKSIMLSGPFLEMFTQKPKTLTELLDEFYQFKKDELNNRLSYKDYKSLINSLKDFQTSKKIKLTLEKMNTPEFMVQYRNFLSEKRPDGYLTKGGLNDNTINKRFSTLKTFFRWVEDKEIYKFKSVVHRFKIQKFDNDPVVLTMEEIENLYTMNIDNPTWGKIRDVFICNCFMGLRISDLKTIKREEFHLDEDGDYILVKENLKTKTKSEILIDGICLDILKKYEFQLPEFSDQYFNTQLKKLLEDKKLFEDMVIKKKRVNKEIKDYSIMRRKLISSHSCRRTFITIGILKNIPLNILMMSSGHKQIQTLQKYMKKVMMKEELRKIQLKPNNVSN